MLFLVLQRCRKTRNFRFFFIGLLCLCGFGIILSLYPSKNVKQCFQRIALPDDAGNSPLLLLDVLAATRQPNPGRSIFFHETSCYLNGRSHVDSLFNLIAPKPIHLNVATLTAREACAVESAALHNPNFDVFVLFASPAYWINESRNSVVDAVLSYSNVHLRNLDLWSYAANTPINEWFQSDELFSSSFVFSHISDFLRYLTLYHWGGTYLDLDVVVLRSLEDLPPNYAGAESEHFVAAGVMNFGHEEFGRKIAALCLDDFQQNFNGQNWGNNGPGVITRILKQICKADEVAGMLNRTRCGGFQVHRPKAFYAVPWVAWENFFDADKMDDTLKSVEHSYVAHVWNKYSIKRKHRVGTPGAYGELAKKHCPKVYATLTELF